MELFTAIALLCQVSGYVFFRELSEKQLRCQQSYVHCVNLKSISLSKEEALNKCILERKL